MKNALIFAFVFAVLAAGCGQGDVEEEVGAYPDYVFVALGETVTIDAAANDVGFLGEVTVEFVDVPVAGSAQQGSDGVFEYVADDLYIGADTYRYRITDESGQSDEAMIFIDVGCDECMDGVNLRLRWDPNDPAEQVIGYRVYFGLEEAAESMEMLVDVTADTPGFDYAQPGVAFDAWYDLGLELGDTACFRATAYNSAGESIFSPAVCKPVTDKAQTTLYFGL